MAIILSGDTELTIRNAELNNTLQRGDKTNYNISASGMVRTYRKPPQYTHTLDVKLIDATQLVDFIRRNDLVSIRFNGRLFFGRFRSNPIEVIHSDKWQALAFQFIEHIPANRIDGGVPIPTGTIYYVVPGIAVYYGSNVRTYVLTNTSALRYVLTGSIFYSLPTWKYTAGNRYIGSSEGPYTLMQVKRWIL